MAIKVNLKKNNLKLENTYLKLREVSIQDSGVVILKSNIYETKGDRKFEINSVIHNLPNFFLKEDEGKEFIELVFKKAYELLKKKKCEDDKLKEEIINIDEEILNKKKLLENMENEEEIKKIKLEINDLIKIKEEKYNSIILKNIDINFIEDC